MLGLHDPQYLTAAGDWVESVQVRTVLRPARGRRVALAMFYVVS